MKVATTLKKQVETILNRKVETVTKDFCFRVKGSLTYEEEKAVSLKTSLCIYTYKNEVILMK